MAKKQQTKQEPAQAPAQRRKPTHRLYRVVGDGKLALAQPLEELLLVAFLERHARIKGEFELEVMRLMSEVMAHTITLHLLDAPGRVQRFMRKNTDLAERLPKKELASYLNLSPETLSRLKRRGKI